MAHAHNNQNSRSNAGKRKPTQQTGIASTTNFKQQHCDCHSDDHTATLGQQQTTAQVPWRSNDELYNCQNQFRQQNQTATVTITQQRTASIAHARSYNNNATPRQQPRENRASNTKAHSDRYTHTSTQHGHTMSAHTSSAPATKQENKNNDTNTTSSANSGHEQHHGYTRLVTQSSHERRHIANNKEREKKTNQTDTNAHQCQLHPMKVVEPNGKGWIT